MKSINLTEVVGYDARLANLRKPSSRTRGDALYEDYQRNRSILFIESRQ